MRLILCVALCLACATAQRKQLAENEIDCGKEAIASEMTALIPQVTLALADVSPGMDWHSQLDALKVTAGDALLCSVAAVIRSLVPSVASVAPQRALYSATPPQATAVQNARAYLDAQQIKRVPVLR